jgi:hypothetical protein
VREDITRIGASLHHSSVRQSGSDFPGSDWGTPRTLAQHLTPRLSKSAHPRVNELLEMAILRQDVAVVDLASSQELLDRDPASTGVLCGLEV